MATPINRDIQSRVISTIADLNKSDNDHLILRLTEKLGYELTKKWPHCTKEEMMISRLITKKLRGDFGIKWGKKQAPPDALDILHYINMINYHLATSSSFTDHKLRALAEELKGHLTEMYGVQALA
jgi:hypothetical protein